MTQTKTNKLFWICFTAMAATAFAFVIRNLIIGDLGREFGLSETQKGELLGVGLWPFALSIVIFSLIADKIGYKTSMTFALLCHLVSITLTLFATGYWSLYVATFLISFGNGTVEAIVNPVIATLYSKDKTKWLNIMHAGWPLGLVIGGLLVVSLLGPGISWRVKAALIYIPTLIYGVLLIKSHFPVQERVKANIPYKEMLKEAGIVGIALIVSLIIAEVGRAFSIHLKWQILAALLIIVPYGLYVRSAGKILLIILLVIIIPVATTELVIDSWITELIQPTMQAIGLQSGWIIIYSAAIVLVLRLFAGPLVHKFKPLGLLAICSLLAAIGLLAFSKAAGLWIFAAATIFGLGKTFFWPTMIGLVSERFPRGGALTCNLVSAVGMMTAGVIGAAFIGNVQDRAVVSGLHTQQPAVYEKVVTIEKNSILGKYKTVDFEKVAALGVAEKENVTKVVTESKKSALATAAILPGIMLVFYLGLIVYFSLNGGYKPIDINEVKYE
jgi:MFS family permease